MFPSALGQGRQGNMPNDQGRCLPLAMLFTLLGWDGHCQRICPGSYMKLSESEVGVPGCEPRLPQQREA